MVTIPDNEADFIELYQAYVPKGSGPLSMMRMIRALMEEIARTRGYNLPEDK